MHWWKGIWDSFMDSSITKTTCHGYKTHIVGNVTVILDVDWSSTKPLTVAKAKRTALCEQLCKSTKFSYKLLKLNQN